jgi:hypothetical protein
MTATRLDITIEQGADYVGSFALSFDLSSYAAAMQIKYAPDYPYAILTLTSANGGLMIDGMTVTAIIPKAVTATLNPARYVYDLKLFDPECLASRPFQGTVCVSPQVTDLVLCPAPAAAAILLENGSYLLLENGGRILLEDDIASNASILLEDGGYLLTENGGQLLLENQ